MHEKVHKIIIRLRSWKCLKLFQCQDGYVALRTTLTLRSILSRDGQIQKKEWELTWFQPSEWVSDLIIKSQSTITLWSTCFVWYLLANYCNCWHWALHLDFYYSFSDILIIRPLFPNYRAEKSAFGVKFFCVEEKKSKTSGHLNWNRLAVLE